MSDACCRVDARASSARYRRVLWVALAVNFTMFFVEFGGGLGAHSASLLADAVDFAGDAANYGVSLAVLGMGAHWASRAALVKGFSMMAYGTAVLTKAAWSFLMVGTPQPMVMGAVAVTALVANLSVAGMLYAYRDGDANMRSVWLCTRNDAIGNVAVLAAAIGVFGTGGAWPDLLVATIMATLAVLSGWSTVHLARAELRSGLFHLRVVPRGSDLPSQHLPMHWRRRRTKVNCIRARAHAIPTPLCGRLPSGRHRNRAMNRLTITR